MVTLNAQVKSGGVAVKVLQKLTSISVCESHLSQLTETIGAELAEVRDQQAAENLAGKLEPRVPQPPQVVAVATDGGRIFTRAENAGRGVHEPGWKETKIACLITLSSKVCEVDPHPELPGCFAEQANVDKLVREIKSIRNAKRDAADDDIHGEGDGSSRADSNLLESLVLPPESAIDIACDALDEQGETACPDKPKPNDWRPRRLVRTCVGSLCSSDDFGPKVAAEAQRRNFSAAKRRAFLGDGLPWNWTLQRRHFPDYEPIVDFIHPMTYIYESSRVVASKGGEGEWALCLRWLTACWQGQVSRVLEELRHWQMLNPSPPDEKLAETDARAIVSKALGYLSNNVSRMNYPKYRQAGLPVTSSMVESLIKEFNYRVKGTEKSWLRPSGCESILQVRGAVLCDDSDRLSDFILSRPGCAFYRSSTNQRAREQNNTAA
jgi:hypothetical protein